LALGGLIAAGMVPVVAVAAPRDTIRSGGASDVSDAKRVVVLSAEQIAGRRFTVADSSGDVALRGRLTRARGSARPWRHAAVADLSALRAPGSYRVSVRGLRARRSGSCDRPGRPPAGS
jgi:hypothetical protein